MTLKPSRSRRRRSGASIHAQGMFSNGIRKIDTWSNLIDIELRVPVSEKELHDSPGSNFCFLFLFAFVYFIDFAVLCVLEGRIDGRCRGKVVSRKFGTCVKDVIVIYSLILI